MWKKILLLLGLSMNAQAYNLTADFTNGFYWMSLPINVTVIETADSARKAKLENLAKQAIGEWESRTGLSLWDYTTAATSNVIRWSTNFAAETNMDPSSVLAVAIRYTQGPYFARTEIVINGGHYLNSSTNNLLTTITHELGHTMGLDHSGNMQALMAPTLQVPYYGLHSDDIKGMREADSITKDRQLTGYISPLSYSKSSSSSSAMSCGTVTTVSAPSASGMISLGTGMLIGFLKKIINWFKSRL